MKRGVWALAIVVLVLALGGCTLAPAGWGPVVGMVYSPMNGEVPLLVRFECRSVDRDGIIVFRVWDFGDGTVWENAPDVVHHWYRSEGTFYPTLTVRDDKGLSATARVQIVAGESYPLDVVEWRAEATHFGQRVVGKVRNIGERKINIGRVAVRFYDKDWNLVQERSKSLGDIPPGGEQIFEITSALRPVEIGGAPNRTIYTEVLHTDHPLSLIRE